MTSKLALATLAPALAVAGVAWGQGAGTAAPSKSLPPPSAASAPDRSVATFGHWMVRCERRGEPHGVQRVCDVAQTTQRTDDGATQSVITIGQETAADPILLTVVVPLNIWVGKPPTLTGEGAILEAVWRFCLPTGCVATAPIDEERIRRLAAQTKPATLEFREAEGRDVGISVSPKGLSDAYASWLSTAK